MKSFLLIVFALFIDGLQAMLSLAFLALQAVTPIGGGVAGIGAGFAWCWNSSEGIWALFTTAQCMLAGGIVGAGASFFAIPLAAVIDFGISLTFGGALIFFLAWSGMFYPGSVLAAFGAEAVPGVNILPGWTLLVVRCMYKKRAEEGRGGLSSALAGVSLGSVPGKEAGALQKSSWAAGRINALRQQNNPVSPNAPRIRDGQRVPLQPLAFAQKGIDGIRPRQNNENYGRAAV